MNWLKTADVTPGTPNKDIKPGTTDTSIGKEFKEEQKSKVLDEPSGVQKAVKPTTDNSIGEQFKGEDNQKETDAPKGKQSPVPQKTHKSDVSGEDYKAKGKTMSSMIGAGGWLKQAEGPAEGAANTEIKPGTKDEKIGYEFKEKDGESIKVLDEPSGEQKEPQTGVKDEKIGEEYKGTDNQEKTNAPEGDQKEISMDTHESDVNAEDYKAKDITLGSSMLKATAWLKGTEPAKLPEKFASFGDVADSYATLLGFYTQATGDAVDGETFGRAIASIGLKESDAMLERIDRMITALAKALSSSKTQRLAGWKQAVGGVGFVKKDEGLFIVAKTEAEAERIDCCVEAKLKDMSFKPKAGKTKKESAYASCAKSAGIEVKADGEGEAPAEAAPAAVPAPAAEATPAEAPAAEAPAAEAPAAEAAPATEEVKAQSALVKSLAEGVVARSAKEPAFMAKIEAAAKEAKMAALAYIKKSCEDTVKRCAHLQEKGVDLVRLAHYRLDCTGCYDAVIGNIEKGLIPTDFLKK